MEGLGDTYLPGAISLLDQLDKQVLVVLRDGKTLLGILRTIDQFANLLLEDTIERIHVEDAYGELTRGIYLVRGENVVLAGEVDMDIDVSRHLRRVPVEQILAMQQIKLDEQKHEQEVRRKVLAKKGVKMEPIIEDAY